METVDGVKVVGLDSVNDYYDISLKEYRLNELSAYSKFTFIKCNIADKATIEEIFTTRITSYNVCYTKLLRMAFKTGKYSFISLY